ncbi:MAG: prolyl oligopeptidase family serine peptidase [Pseudomonadales bacterium]
MKNIKNKILAVLAMSFALFGSTVIAQESSTTYNRIDKVMDWGATTTHLIVDLGTEIRRGRVDADTFSVHVRRSDPRLEEPFLEEGTRNVVDAYISDENGNAVRRGRYATLVMEIGPSLSLGNALNYGRDPDVGRSINAWSHNEYTITQQEPIRGIDGTLIASEMDQYLQPGINQYEFDSASYEDEEYGLIEMQYAHFSPEEDSGQNPLIIWLHGGGEGGTDPTIPLAGNRADAFASEETQVYFGGAYVLVPQSPTRWMHGPTGQQGSGEKEDALSIYTDALQDLVETFVTARSDIDTDRIYIAGASNGGWMAVRLILDNPDYYAAALPVCEPLDLNYVSDEELAGITDIPIWLVTAATDETVEPELFPVPLYSQLRSLGAENIHLSFLPNVTDMTGTYQAEDGTPYEYNGHWSWIPVYNNHLAYVEGSGQLYGPIVQELDSVGGREVVTLMEWLAAQSK